MIPNASSIRRTVPATLPLLIGIVAVIVLSITAKFALSTGIIWQCPVMTALHLPCPSCGSTRALAALGEFRFWEALCFNPLIILMIGVGPIAYGLRARLAGSRAAWAVFIGAVVLNWLYLLFFLPR